jgi:hypothetical protein
MTNTHVDCTSTACVKSLPARDDPQNQFPHSPPSDNYLKPRSYPFPTRVLPATIPGAVTRDAECSEKEVFMGGGDFFVVDAINELVVDNRNGEVLMVLEIVSATIAL